VNQWYTVAELTADVLAVLDAEALSRVHLVGHGLGGTIALELALRVPDRLQSLVLVDPALQVLADGTHDTIARDALLDLRSNDRAAADAAYKHLFDRALDTYWLPRRGTTWRQSLTKAQLGAIRRHAPALAALLPALDAYKVDDAALRGLTCPSLIIVSDTTSRLDSIANSRLADLLPRARLATWATVGTEPYRPGVLNDDLHHLIHEFIARESDRAFITDQ
jgi:pimeloyl-ACP methyl ester carboxylesterase